MTSEQETVRAIVKEMTQPTRRRAKASVAQIAERCDVSRITVYKWAEADGGNDIPAWKIPALTRATSDTLLLQHIAAQCDHIAIPVPKKRRADIAKALEEFGEFVRRFGEAVADNVVTEIEARALDRKAEETIQAILYATEQAKLMRGKPVAAREPNRGAM